MKNKRLIKLLIREVEAFYEAEGYSPGLTKDEGCELIELIKKYKNRKNNKIKFVENLIEEMKTGVANIFLPSNFFEDYKDVLIYNNLGGVIVYEYVIRDSKNRINKLLTFETYKPEIRLIENGDMARILDEDISGLDLVKLDHGGMYNKNYIVR
jgi:hypothetical protein